jgi:TonB family protein
MALREKFGKLVLIEETGSGALGREYRAARLGPAGLDRLVTVLRFGPGVSSNAEATKRLMDEARLAARLQNPGLVRVLGIGRVEQSVYVSTELVEGRSVAAVLDRCRGEAFPFAADHALMIASRAAVALEFLHGKKLEGGAGLFHGLVAPSRIVVVFDGEVKLTGLGLWPALRGTDLLPVEERRYLAPEQVAGEAGDARSDVYALGLVLLEALTGQALDGQDPLDALTAARVTGTTGEQGALPKPLVDLLRRALGREPAQRFSGMADLRKAIDALLFSGDFSPTTFDLAFFMHTLFREDMEREARALEEARRGDYGEFLPEEKGALPAPAATKPDSSPARHPAPTATAGRDRPPEATTEVVVPTLAESARPAAPDRPPPAAGPEASGSRSAGTRASREAAAREAAREAASRMTLGAAAEAPGGRGGLWLLLGLLAAVALGGGGGWYYLVKLRPSSPSVAAGSDTAGAQARVRELEERIAQLEREKAAAETKAADDARSTLEAEAQAGGRKADPVAIERAQEEARRRARAEQEARQEEERRRIAEEKRAEEERLAEATPPPAPVPEPTPVAMPTSSPTPVAEAMVATLPAATAGTSAPTPVPTPAAPPTATPVPSPVAPERRGALVDINDPAVVPPALVRQPPVAYPDIARQARVDGVVQLTALVDENGRVVDVKLVRSSRPGYRFEAEAERHARARRYRPATMGGVAVRVWLPIIVNFKHAP